MWRRKMRIRASWIIGLGQLFCSFGMSVSGAALAPPLVVSSYTETVPNKLGEATLSLVIHQDAKEKLALQIPFYALAEDSWRQAGRFLVDWRHCQAAEFQQGSGELNQCIRHGRLAVDGEWDTLKTGYLEARLHQDGSLAIKIFDRFALVRQSFLAGDPQRLLAGLVNQIGTENLPAPVGTGSDLAKDSVDFVFLGDAGKGNAAQYAVGNQMAGFCATEACDFGLMLGDNIYNDGVGNVADAKFRSHFEKPYAAISFPFYVVLGNHDHRGNIQAQIKYSEQSALWKMPSRYYSFTRGDVAFFAIDSDEFDSRQRQWLASKLAASSAPWKVVYAHHPVFSYGSHGNTKYLVKGLLPLLKKYGVQFYLNGHDHDKQHIVRDGINFITVGTAATTRSVKRGSYSRYASSRLGFGHLSFAVDHAQLRFLDSTGQPEYSQVIPL